MKTFLAALAAGLIGGGSALGVVALDIFPQQPTAKVAATCGPCELPAEPAQAPDTRDDEIAALKLQIAALEVRLDKQTPADNSATVVALEKEVAALKSDRASVPTPAGSDSEGVVVSPAPAVTPEFDSAVREVLTRVAEERVEERRLNQQAERLVELEEQKLTIAEYVPKLVEKQAGNLGIAEAVIPDVSNALVAHAQFRAEIVSEIKGQKIDGLETDEAANKAKFEQLHASTVLTLSSYVDAETAEKLVNSLDKAGRKQADGNKRAER